MNARRRAGWSFAAGLAFAAPTPAWAHVGQGLASGFAAGFGHPFAGLDHLLAMVAVGLWGAVLGQPLVALLPVVFPTVMAAGAAAGMAALPLPPVELGIAASVLLLGSAVALAVRPPAWAAGLVVAVFAVFHGYAHGQELPAAADPTGYSAGFVIATGLLHLTGVGIGWLTERPSRVLAGRGLGALIAAAGIVFVARAVAA